MDRFAALLIAAIIALAPLGSIAAARCACEAPATHASEVISEGCCSAPSGPADPADEAPDRNGPCNDCECPMSCCGAQKAPTAATIPPRPVMTEPARAAPVRIDTPILAAAHLDRLKRPPRPMPRSC